MQISGKVLGEDFYKSCILMTSIASFILFGFVVSLWISVLTSQHMALILSAIILVLATMGLVYFFVLVYITYQLISMEYLCANRIISNTYKHAKFCVDLENAFYLTKMNIRFYHGKSSEVKCFYVFAPIPIDQSLCENSGAKAIESFLNNRAVIVPCEKETEWWIKEKVNMNTIPEFPKVLYRPSIKV